MSLVKYLSQIWSKLSHWKDNFNPHVFIPNKAPHDSSSSEKQGWKIADLKSIHGKVLEAIEEKDA